MIKINFPIWLIAGSSVFFVFGVLNSDGKAGKTGAPGENTCAQCHSGTPINGSAGAIDINTSTIVNDVFELSQTYNLSVTVSESGRALFGFSIVALDANGNSVGTFIPGSDNHADAAMISGINRQYLTHNFNGGVSLNSHTFNFEWTAPSENFGPITFYATGNAADGNQASSGDHIYSTSKQLILAAPIGVFDSEANGCLVWNKNSHLLSLKGKSAEKICWTIFDLNGKVVKSISNQKFVDLSELADGFYVARCMADDKSLELKLVK